MTEGRGLLTEWRTALVPKLEKLETPGYSQLVLKDEPRTIITVK